MPGDSAIRQAGFSLLEATIAALCLAVSLLGLLQYHQGMQQGFLRQWQQRDAWHLAYQQLAIYSAGQGYDASALLGRDLAPGWQLTLTAQVETEACRQVVSTVTTPQHYQAQLRRWFC